VVWSAPPGSMCKAPCLSVITRPVVSYPTLYHHMPSHPIISYPILYHHMPSHPILSYPTTLCHSLPTSSTAFLHFLPLPPVLSTKHTSPYLLLFSFPIPNSYLFYLPPPINPSLPTFYCPPSHPQIPLFLLPTVNSQLSASHEDAWTVRGTQDHSPGTKIDR
jgi:hypothetical protein